MARPKKEVIQPEDKYVIRFPDGMRDQLKEAAKENNRSLNAEIIARLEDYNRLEKIEKEKENFRIQLEKELDGASRLKSLLLDKVTENNRYKKEYDFVIEQYGVVVSSFVTQTETIILFLDGVVHNYKELGVLDVKNIAKLKGMLQGFIERQKNNQSE